MQHTSSVLGEETFFPICTAPQPQTLCRSLAEFTGADSSASSADPSAALGAPSSPLLHLRLSPLQSIPCTQAPAHRAHSCSRSPSRSSKRASHSKQAKDISEIKSQMAQVLEYLVRQQALPPAPAPALPPVPAPESTPPSLAVTPDVSE
ncbi:UNVERIFIED_CONTAM: hypothetical protein FKN15_044692 [Acipenser sinensis]